MNRFRREIVICLLLVAANLVVFGQVVTHDFVTLDDYRYVVENPKVRTGLTREGFIWAGFTVTGIPSRGCRTWQTASFLA